MQHWHYNRENNAVVEFRAAHQSITEFMLLRKSGLKVGDRVAYAALIDADRFALKAAADSHNALEARATSGSTILTT